MSSAPYGTSRTTPPNLAILLRRPFQAAAGAVDEALRAAGHGAIRPAHGNVFQYVEREGTSVSTLAERAQMTKQSMAELVAHLERHGYVERVPDRGDRRVKRVRLTDRGRETVPIAEAAIEATTRSWADALGTERLRALEELLRDLNDVLDANGDRTA